MHENSSNSHNQMPQNSPKLTPLLLTFLATTAAGGWCCRRSNNIQLAAGGNGTLSVSHGLAIIPHARLAHHPPHRKGGTGTRRQRPPHALPAARTPPRIGSTSQPTRAAGVVKDKNPRRSNAAHASARPPRARQGSCTLGPRPRIPRTAPQPASEPARGWMDDGVWGGGGGSRGRGRAD
jgi:hypothetical protein